MSTPVEQIFFPASPSPTEVVVYRRSSPVEYRNPQNTPASSRGNSPFEPAKAHVTPTMNAAPSPTTQNTVVTAAGSGRRYPFCIMPPAGNNVEKFPSSQRKVQSSNPGSKVNSPHLTNFHLNRPIAPLPSRPNRAAANDSKVPPKTGSEGGCTSSGSPTKSNGDNILTFSERVRHKLDALQELRNNLPAQSIPYVVSHLYAEIKAREFILTYIEIMSDINTMVMEGMEKHF